MRLKSPLPHPLLRLKLRTERQWLLGRAIRRRGRLATEIDRTGQIGDEAILAFVALGRTPGGLADFLAAYRGIGIGHFLIVDPGGRATRGDDGPGWLREQSDVSLWRLRLPAGAVPDAAGAVPDAAGAVRDALAWLRMRHGHGHWCFTVDAGDRLVYPFCDCRPLTALTDWLDSAGQRAFPAMQLDLYPRPGHPGEWFDPANYAIRRCPDRVNLRIRGGVQARLLHADDPSAAPDLNRIPLVRWHWRQAYVDGTHMLLPRSLNRVYDEDGGEAISGCLLRPLDPAVAAAGAWCDQSVEYRDWRQLQQIGLMSQGHWA